MNPCEECSLEDKVYECCGRFPDTGEVAYLKIDEQTGLYACPYLDRNGLCTIYENRPLGCRDHYCSRFNSYTRIARQYEDILSQCNLTDTEE